jgi:murein DD-endopeptidase MepM/ murein hydrolase activator NlpD
MNNLHLLNKGSRKNNSRGFYIALGVCLIAIGVAAWTTYDSVVNYAAPDEKTTSSTVAKQTNEAVSGIKVFASEPESTPSVSSEAASSQAVSSAAAAKQTIAKVPAKQAVAPALTFTYPVGKTIEQKYSGQNPIYSKTMKDWRAHTGVDFTAKQGEAVKAIANGTVKNVYVDDLYGNTIVITHGDVEAYYCGLNQMSVKTGDKVKQGAQIGTVGTVPCESADAPHMHLSMKKSSKFIDPLSVLK